MLTGACYLMVNIASCDQVEIPSELSPNLKGNVYFKAGWRYDALVS